MINVLSFKIITKLMYYYHLYIIILLMLFIFIIIVNLNVVIFTIITKINTMYTVKLIEISLGQTFFLAGG